MNSSDVIIALLFINIVLVVMLGFHLDYVVDQAVNKLAGRTEGSNKP